MSFGNVIYPETLFFKGGLVTVVNGSATVTGHLNAVAGTAPAWLSAALAGDTIAVGSTRHYILGIVSDNELTLTEPWSGPSATEVAYTGARAPWHLADRALAYKFAKFLENDASAASAAREAADDALDARTDTITARDIAAAWASRPLGIDVTTPGTRSALHYASTASSAAQAAASSVVAAGDQATLAQGWSEKPDDVDVTTPGTRSARHWSNRAGSFAATVADDKAIVAGDKALVFEARDITIGKASLAQEWAEKPIGQAVTGTVDGRSAKHWAAASADSAAAAAAIVFNAVNMIDYGLLTDVPTDFADYGTL